MVEKLEIVISATDGASGVMRGIHGVMSGLGDVAQGALTIGLGAATVAFGALASGVGIAISEAIDAQKGLAQLDAVLKSTGGAAGVTREAALSLADALGKTTTFSDDQVLAGENLLLTFTNIGKDVFPDATQAMVDMASAMGTDAKSGAIQLGKALNDPVAGISALSRVGVTFTEDQKKVIEQLVKTGDVAGAQKVILAELAKEFCGSAAAQAETFSGKLTVLKNRLLDAAEGIGTALLPGLTTLFDSVIAPAIPLIESLAGVLGGAITDFIDSGGDLGVVADDLREGLMGLVPPEAIAAISGLILYIRDDLPGALAAAQAAVQPVADAAANLAQAFIASLPLIRETVGEMVAFVQAQFAALSPVLIANVSSTLNSLAEFWRAHGDEIMAVVKIAFEFITVTVGGTLTLVSGLLSAAMAAINGDWSGAWTTIQATTTTFMNSVLSIVGTDLETFTATWSANWEMAKIIVSTVWTAMQDSIAATLGGIADQVMASIWGIIGSIQATIADFTAIGSAIIAGIQSGIDGAVSGLIASAVGAVASAIGAAKAALGIRSPSSVFADIGSQMMTGMAQGIQVSTVAPTRALAGATPQLAQTAIISRAAGRPNAISGAAPQIVINYAPLLSLGDRVEFETRVIPLIRDALRAG